MASNKYIIMFRTSKGRGGTGKEEGEGDNNRKYYINNIAY